jgi:hypothetical protein
VRTWLAGYLVGWLFWLSVSLGSVGLLQTHALTGGVWGGKTRKAWQAAAGLLPWLAVLFLPVLAGVGRLYPWADGGHGYLTVPYFAVRASIYLLVWCALSLGVARPVPGAPALTERFPALWAGFGLVAFILSATFASFDWMATLEPRWTSTVFGLTFIAGCGLAALSLGAILAAPAGAEETARQDIGNLMLAFTMLWAYCAFSQFLVIWSGDVPREISWYINRTRHGWQAVALTLAFGHFVIPFTLLLWRRVKRQAGSLSAVAALVLAGCWLDLCWMVAPAVTPESLWTVAQSLLGALLVGAAWLWLFRRSWAQALAAEAA